MAHGVFGMCCDSVLRVNVKKFGVTHAATIRSLLVLLKEYHCVPIRRPLCPQHVVVRRIARCKSIDASKLMYHKTHRYVPDNPNLTNFDKGIIIAHFASKFVHVTIYVR